MTARRTGDGTLDGVLATAWSSGEGSMLPSLAEKIERLGGDDVDASFSIGADPEAVTAARHFTVEMLREWGFSLLCDDVGLVVSELITNALRHSHPPCPVERERSIRLRLLYSAPYLLCGVQDAGIGLPRRREPDYIAETGRGLHIVESFSVRWGWTLLDPHGKLVWALFRLPRGTR